MFYKGLLIVVYGFLTHYVKLFTNRIEYIGWRTISNFTAGILLLFPCAKWLYNDVHIKDNEYRFEIAHFIAALFYGIGVCIAWVVNPLEPGQKL